MRVYNLLEFLTQRGSFVMARVFPVRYGEFEEAILLHLYNNPNPRLSHTTHNLAGALMLQELQDPNDLGLEDETRRAKIRQAFVEMQSAIESLILHRLVKGDRERDSEMIHFTNLKLTAKGEAEAIRLRREHEASEMQMRVADAVSGELTREAGADEARSTPPPPSVQVSPSFIRPGLGDACTLCIHEGPNIIWRKTYRSEQLAWLEAEEMGLISKSNPQGLHGDPAQHPLSRALVSETAIDMREIRKRGFLK
jgi:hypothetical protein